MLEPWAVRLRYQPQPYCQLREDFKRPPAPANLNQRNRIPPSTDTWERGIKQTAANGPPEGSGVASEAGGSRQQAASAAGPELTCGQNLPGCPASSAGLTPSPHSHPSDPHAKYARTTAAHPSGAAQGRGEVGAGPRPLQLYLKGLKVTRHLLTIIFPSALTVSIVQSCPGGERGEGDPRTQPPTHPPTQRARQRAGLSGGSWWGAERGADCSAPPRPPWPYPLPAQPIAGSAPLPRSPVRGSPLRSAPRSPADGSSAPHRPAEPAPGASCHLAAARLGNGERGEASGGGIPLGEGVLADPRGGGGILGVGWMFCSWESGCIPR